MGDIDFSLLSESVTAGLVPPPFFGCGLPATHIFKQGAFQPSVCDPQQTLRGAGLLNGTVFVLPSD